MEEGAVEIVLDRLWVVEEPRWEEAAGVQEEVARRLTVGEALMSVVEVVLEELAWKVFSSQVVEASCLWAEVVLWKMPQI